MLGNRSIPDSTVIPELAYPDIGEAVKQLCDCFEFTLRIRIGSHRAQLNVEAGAVVLIEAGGGVGMRSPVLVSRSRSGMWILRTGVGLGFRNATVT
jgi:hypothetical protein